LFREGINRHELATLFQLDIGVAEVMFAQPWMHPPPAVSEEGVAQYPVRASNLRVCADGAALHAYLGTVHSVVDSMAFDAAWAEALLARM
jgi:hypothetical protein